MEMRRAYLIRHGQTEWNKAQKAQGHTDIPLDELGLAQADALAQAFEGRHLENIFSSDLLRCVGTAKPLANETQAALITTPDLRERGFGDLEGRPYREIREASHASGLLLEEYIPPNGESMMMVRARLERFLDQLPGEGGDFAIVSHGGSCSLLLAMMLGGHPAVSRGFRFGNTGLCELSERAPGEWNLVRYNDTHHLVNIENAGAFGVVG